MADAATSLASAARLAVTLNSARAHNDPCVGQSRTTRRATRHGVLTAPTHRLRPAASRGAPASRATPVLRHDRTHGVASSAADRTLPQKRLVPGPHIVNFPLALRLCSANVRLAAGRERGDGMVARVSTVAFEGVEARPVDVQVQVASGNVVFNIVGLGDKAVRESQERVRSALTASGLALPAKRITVNLAPADLPKEGSHYDLPIALGVMAAIGAVPPTRSKATPSSASSRSTGRSARSPACCRPRSPPTRRGKGLICPARVRARGGLGLGRSRHPRAALADPARQPFQGDADPGAACSPPCVRRARRSRTCATSRARRAPSARSRSPPPAATTC